MTTVEISGAGKGQGVNAYLHLIYFLQYSVQTTQSSTFIFFIKWSDGESSRE